MALPSLRTLAATGCVIALGCGGADETTPPKKKTSSSAASSGAGGAGGAGGGTVASSAEASTAAASSTQAASSATGAGGSCVDPGPGEPNDDELSAYQLATIGCADGDGGKAYGVLEGASDADWYVYQGLDSANCIVDATQELALDAGGARLCAFFECVSADTEVTCPANTTPATSPNGRAGCCGDGAFEVSGLNCVLTPSEDIAVFIRVDQATADCPTYTLTFHY